MINLQIDNGPAILAYCQARLDQLKRLTPGSVDGSIDELERVIVLCDGLEKQNELMKSADRMKPYVYEPKPQ